MFVTCFEGKKRVGSDKGNSARFSVYGVEEHEISGGSSGSIKLPPKLSNEFDLYYLGCGQTDFLKDRDGR